ncbi:MAG: ComF family protein [Clostridia bacterium]|nr:ComF family protein [Clostridia bacterium]
MKIKLFQLLQDLLFPPHCAACGKLLAPCSVTPLCDDCHKIWAREVLSQCDKCFLPMHSCLCVPDNMKKQGVCAYVKMAPYGADNGRSVTARMILGAKKQPDRRLFCFFARELRTSVRAALHAADRAREKQGLSIPSAVICWLPRNRDSVREYGFDQAELLAKALGRDLGYPVLPLLKRVRDTAPQKTLSARARAANMTGAFRQTGKAPSSRVILVDDVVTTGAGMSEAAKELGNPEIIAVSVAITEKRRGN